MANENKVPCGGFVLGEGLELAEDGKTLNATGGGGVQSDWNQNDETAPDYVKNRPGGYVEEQYVEEYNGTVKNNAQIFSIALMEQVGTAGTVFRVNWDNVEYSCTSQNGFIGDKEYNLCPFIITSEDAGELFQGITVQTNDENDHSLTIEALIPVYIKINDNFLPLNNIESINCSAVLNIFSKASPNVLSNSVEAFIIGAGNTITGVANASRKCIIGERNTGSSYSNAEIIVGHDNISQAVYPSLIVGHDLTAHNGGLFLGKYNAQGNLSSALTIGNGSSDRPHNAFAVTDKGELIVPSSTSGSSKYFAITVDDTGTIKATEVVLNK